MTGPTTDDGAVPVTVESDHDGSGPETGPSRPPPVGVGGGRPWRRRTGSAGLPSLPDGTAPVRGPVAPAARQHPGHPGPHPRGLHAVSAGGGRGPRVGPGGRSGAGHPPLQRPLAHAAQGLAVPAGPGLLGRQLVPAHRRPRLLPPGRPVPHRPGVGLRILPGLAVAPAGDLRRHRADARGRRRGPGLCLCRGSLGRPVVPGAPAL